jgi:hypothetical protein
MKLPARDRAHVPERKLIGYLLSLSHPVGGPKARFFRRHGFDDSRADLLREEFLGIAKRADVTGTEETAYGTKYILDGSVTTPRGENVAVRTVWMIEDRGPEAPRFVTAYPV